MAHRMGAGYVLMPRPRVPLGEKSSETRVFFPPLDP
jgi:hypothetical protein